MPLSCYLKSCFIKLTATFKIEELFFVPSVSEMFSAQEVQSSLFYLNR
ncbi:hypothetical protein PT2222_140034 [Paraburkholderia tropica]